MLRCSSYDMMQSFNMKEIFLSANAMEITGRLWKISSICFKQQNFDRTLSNYEKTLPGG